MSLTINPIKPQSTSEIKPITTVRYQKGISFTGNGDTVEISKSSKEDTPPSTIPNPKASQEDLKSNFPDPKQSQDKSPKAIQETFYHYYNQIRMCDKDYYSPYNGTDTIFSSWNTIWIDDKLKAQNADHWNAIMPKISRDIGEIDKVISLNVHPTIKLIKQLGDFTYEHKETIVQFKFPSNNEGYLTRHDPISMYLTRELPGKALKKLKKIVRPYVRKPASQNKLDVLIGRKRANGISIAEFGTPEKVTDLLLEAYETLLELGKGLDQALGIEKGTTACSSGELQAMKEVIKFMKRS